LPALEKILALSVHALTLWDLPKSAFFRGTAGENFYGLDRLAQAAPRI